MKFFTLNFDNSECKSIEEQIIFATMTAINKPGHIVRWLRSQDDISVCISYSDIRYKISIANITDELQKRLVGALTKLFGQSKTEYWKVNSLNLTQRIFYIEWGGDACDDLKEEMGILPKSDKRLVI